MARTTVPADTKAGSYMEAPPSVWADADGVEHLVVAVSESADHGTIRWHTQCGTWFAERVSRMSGDRTCDRCTR